MRTVSTANSTYEIDEAENLIRRVHGVNAPTERQGADGEWKAYETLVFPLSGGLLIVWGVNTDGTNKCTWTSNLISDNDG